MYDELVKRLNKYSAEHENHGGITAEAADAIEELTKDLERSKEWESFWEEEANRAKEKIQQYALAVANKPHWIPVTERLPLLHTPVLATDGIEVDISWMCGVPPRWITSYTAIDEDKLTHWMPLPQTPKEK